MEYKVLNNGLKMPMVGLGVYQPTSLSLNVLKTLSGTGVTASLAMQTKWRI